MRPTSLWEVVERSRPDGDWDHHLRDFLDAFYAAHGDRERQSRFIAEPPGSIGEARADAFIGGVGEHLARRWGVSIPAWVRDEARYLTTAIFLPDEKALRGYLIGVSPVAFRVRLIFTAAEPLQRASFPRDATGPVLPLNYPVRPAPGPLHAPQEC